MKATVKLKQQPSARYFRRVEEWAKHFCLCGDKAEKDKRHLCHSCAARQILNDVVLVGKT